MNKTSVPLDGKVFEGRSINVIGDLSTDEQMHLYAKAKELKDAKQNGRKDLEELFKIKDNAYGIQTIFREDSTRTKQSFTHAAQFLDVKLNDFNPDKSSLKKKESYKDTINMLTGYHNNIYVIRSELEGVCTYLEQKGKKYAERHNLPVAPAFINAGDGTHEHPTQELLDEFTFLEHRKGDRKNFHMGIIGDLDNGRTVHSKADGLKIFGNVEIDLVAPPGLEMPKEYLDKMKYNGYKINPFHTLTQYFSNPERVAPILYFTRPQLERWKKELLERQDELRKAITFTREHYDILKKIGLEKFKFFHPLPRNSEHPEIPYRVDETSLNGRETQALNGYYIRAALMSAIAGNPHVNSGFTGEVNSPISRKDSFIEDADIVPKVPEERVVSEGFRPIDNGVVIDHICKGKDSKEINKSIQKVINTLPYLLGKKTGSYVYSQESKSKGILFRPDTELKDDDIRNIASLIPGSTINIIKDKQVVKKMRIKLPPTMGEFPPKAETIPIETEEIPSEKLPDIHCNNEKCITHPIHNEKISPFFTKKGEDTFVCGYCEKGHNHQDIRESDKRA